MRAAARGVGVIVAAFIVTLLLAGPARAHSLPSVVYADLTSPDSGQVRAEVRMYSPLLLMSTSDYAQDVELGQAGSESQSDQDMPAQAAALMITPGPS